MTNIKVFESYIKEHPIDHKNIFHLDKYDVITFCMNACSKCEIKNKTCTAHYLPTLTSNEFEIVKQKYPEQFI